VLEYMFFDAALMRRFLDAAAAHGVSPGVRDDPIAGTVVAIPEDLADAVLDDLDACYEMLQDEQATAAHERDGWVAKRLAGVQVERADGTLGTISLDAAIANRLLAILTPEEVQELIQEVVRSLENPLDGPLCRMPPP